jgi:hypothetical protein
MMAMNTRSALGVPSSQMYTDEGVLQKKVLEWLAPQFRDGIKAIRICDRYNKGYSDIFINVRGQFVIAELKDDVGVASQHQKDFIRDMVACGAIGGVCRTVKEVADLVEEAKRRRPDWT